MSFLRDVFGLELLMSSEQWPLYGPQAAAAAAASPGILSEIQILGPSSRPRRLRQGAQPSMF